MLCPYCHSPIVTWNWFHWDGQWVHECWLCDQTWETPGYRYGLPYGLIRRLWVLGYKLKLWEADECPGPK